jgi:hypothetical protein
MHLIGMITLCKKKIDLLFKYNFPKTLRKEGFYIMNEEDDLPLPSDTVPYHKRPITDEEAWRFFYD